jgi:hypothetical protein
LLRELPHAERRAVGEIDRAVRVDFAAAQGDLQPAMVMEAPARVIYRVTMPRRAMLHARLALTAAGGEDGRGVQVRVGISDGRFYDELARRSLVPQAGWQPIDVDLSRYSGLQWSLFYRPSRVTWQLILNADPAPGGAAAWAAPRIEVQ